MSDKKLHHCSFCGKHKDQVTKLIVGEDVAICSICIDLCNDLIDKEHGTEKIKQTEDISFDAYSIKEYLDQHVIGQSSAKEVLAVAISNHYKRINHPPKDLEIQKGNVLFVGPAGSGKTLLAKTVAKYIDVPFVVADATNLTEAGYVGEDVESMIAMLLANADNDVSLAERGIVFIDEIDKISRKSESASITRDVSGEGVQQALLKLVEGAKIRVSPVGKRKHPQGENIEVDTKNILFIAGGAFVGLDNIIKGRTNGSSIGFGSTIRAKNEAADLKLVTPDDLTRFGMIPEFIGRFTTAITLEELNLEQLVAVLLNIKNSFIDQYKYIFELDGIKLTFTDEAIHKIARNCIDLKTGARGLHTEIERVLMPAMFHIRKYKETGVTELVVTTDHVDDPGLLVAKYLPPEK
jgi:ATP-dependent Clp protease ATP-binding subunit ClpX